VRDPQPTAIPAPAVSPVAAPDEQYLAVHFLTRLGTAMAVAGASVTMIRTSLESAAQAYGLGSQITVFPTMLLIKLEGREAVTFDVASAMNRSLRLDQIADIWRLVERAEDGRVTPADGLARLDEIWSRRPRFSQAVRLFGYMLMAAGFGLILSPTVGQLVACLILGLIVGEIIALTSGHPTLSVLLPVMASLTVGLLVFLGVREEYISGPVLLLIPPLVMLLPGAMLTTGMLELASGDILSGSSRLVAGATQLVLLLFGLVVAAAAVGLPSADAFANEGGSTFGSWGPWFGVLIFGMGIYLHLSAPARSLPWLLLVLLVAWVGQQSSSLLLGGYLSGFVGALAMTPVAYAIQRWPSAPPAMVSILPAYWMLVPGALGLIELTEIVGDNRQATLADSGTMVFTLVAIALGVTVGEAVRQPLGRWGNLALDRLGVIRPT
jgi:uncharacterized membrane protein YjjP (DUF1212 family)